MSFWATSSRAATTALILGLLLTPAAPAAAKVFLSVDEAVKLALPNCQVEHRTAFLTPAQVQQVKALAGVEMPSALASYYQCKDKALGTVWFDTHRVRTLPETLMIVVDPQGKVTRIEVISFREPEEYMPRGAWYQQFLGKRLDGDLQLKRGIRPVTGASLTARATTDAVRRVLALHQVLVSASARLPSGR
jgi:hypothetical protein